MIDFVPLLELLLLAILGVIAFRRLRIPYTIGLVVIGFVIGILANGPVLAPLAASMKALLAPNLFFDLLLPPIIFEAALHVDYHWIRRRAGLILFLAFVGVVFITVFTGVLLARLAVLPLEAALLLAAILSPTDPIAVVDLFRRLKVPAELATIVESESLLNDAVGVMLFTVLVGVLATGTWSPVGAALQFTWLTFGGLLVGVGVAGGMYLLHRQLNDAPIETALSMVAAYGAFFLADAVGASGIIACAIAGIAVGSFVAPRAVAPDVQKSIDAFWSVVVYVANSVIFLSMGLLFALGHLLDYLGLILVVFVIMTLGRALFVYAERPLSVRGPGRMPNRWYNVIVMSGVRGALPVVLALSLLASPPKGLPTSTVQAIVACVFGVALLSIVLGNVVAGWYVTRSFPPNPAAGPEAAAAGPD